MRIRIDVKFAVQPRIRFVNKNCIPGHALGVAEYIDRAGSCDFFVTDDFFGGIPAALSGYRHSLSHDADGRIACHGAGAAAVAVVHINLVYDIFNVFRIRRGQKIIFRSDCPADDLTALHDSHQRTGKNHLIRLSSLFGSQRVAGHNCTIQRCIGKIAAKCEAVAVRHVAYGDPAAFAQRPCGSSGRHAVDFVRHSVALYVQSKILRRDIYRAARGGSRDTRHNPEKIHAVRRKLQFFTCRYFELRQAAVCRALDD